MSLLLVATVGGGALAFGNWPHDLALTPSVSSDLQTSTVVSLPAVTRVARTPVRATPTSSIRGRTLGLAPAQSGLVVGDADGLYVNWLDGKIVVVDDATASLLDLAVTPERDSAWLIQVTNAVSVWTSAYHDARSLEPLPPFASRHVAVVQAFSQYNDAAATVLTGAQDGNDDLVAKGIDQAFAGESSLTRARAELQAGS